MHTWAMSFPKGFWGLEYPTIVRAIRHRQNSSRRHRRTTQHPELTIYQKKNAWHGIILLHLKQFQPRLSLFCELLVCSYSICLLYERVYTVAGHCSMCSRFLSFKEIQFRWIIPALPRLETPASYVAHVRPLAILT